MQVLLDEYSLHSTPCGAVASAQAAATRGKVTASRQKRLRIRRDMVTSVH